jgi:hypothetical protein
MIKIVVVIIVVIIIVIVVVIIKTSMIKNSVSEILLYVSFQTEFEIRSASVM